MTKVAAILFFARFWHHVASISSCGKSAHRIFAPFDIALSHSRKYNSIGCATAMQKRGRNWRKSCLEMEPLDYGSGMDQNAMMETDELIAVDMSDRAVPGSSISKRKAHEFNNANPRGIAHRAFSVFIFNNKNELLVTQRALSKITFPGVWTNSCCSHPLQGMSPDEVDDGVKSFPDFPGVKHAAVRKLRHELGIQSSEVPHSCFRFITKFHYWAADTITYGREAPWGEHEIDYVLFAKCEGDGPTLNINPDEVEDYKFVTAEELKKMMDDSSLLWSPWFIGIMENGGFEWWSDLDEALKAAGSRYCNRDIIFFDPPKEHMGSYNNPSHGRDTGVLTG